MVWIGTQVVVSSQEEPAVAARAEAAAAGAQGQAEVQTSGPPESAGLDLKLPMPVPPACLSGVQAMLQVEQPFVSPDTQLALEARQPKRKQQEELEDGQLTKQSRKAKAKAKTTEPKAKAAQAAAQTTPKAKAKGQATTLTPGPVEAPAATGGAAGGQRPAGKAKGEGGRPASSKSQAGAAPVQGGRLASSKSQAGAAPVQGGQPASSKSQAGAAPVQPLRNTKESTPLVEALNKRDLKRRATGRKLGVCHAVYGQAQSYIRRSSEEGVKKLVVAVSVTQSAAHFLVVHDLMEQIEGSDLDNKEVVSLRTETIVKVHRQYGLPM